MLRLVGILVAIISLVLIACQPTTGLAPTPILTSTAPPAPTPTSVPSDTPVPTLTPTSAPTATPVPTLTPTPMPTATPVAAAPPVTFPPELIEAGRQVYEEWECFNCHFISWEGGIQREGPDLDNVGNVLAPEAIRAKLRNPQFSMAQNWNEDYNKVIMPDDLAERGLTGEDLDALVAYLSSLRDVTVDTPKPLFPGTEREGSAFYEVPYQDQKFVPVDWWTNEEIVAQGKGIYQANCTDCHGPDGTPATPEATDFTDLDLVESWADPYWYWWIARQDPGSEGGWGEKLSSEDILKVMVYINNLAYGEPVEHFLYPPEAPLSR